MRIVPWPPHGPLDMKLQGEQAELVQGLERFRGIGVQRVQGFRVEASEFRV